MTNKVKPFYIRITDDMTPQMVQDAFDKCVDAGAIANDGCKSALSKNKYSSNFDINNYGVFGVRFNYGTYIEVNSSYFGDAQEITLDQLDEWLGLEVEQEWKSGDECQYSDTNWLFCGFHPTNGLAIVANNDNTHSHQIITVDANLLHKPETPEQKAERERLENGKSLYELVQSIWCTVDSKYTPHPYESPMVCDNTKEMYARLAKAVNYRKQ